MTQPEPLLSDPDLCPKHGTMMEWSDCDVCHGTGEIMREGTTLQECSTCLGFAEFRYCPECYDEEEVL